MSEQLSNSAELASAVAIDRARAGGAVAGLKEVDHSILWIDWALSMGVVLSGAVIIAAATSVPWLVLGITVTSLALYRAALFSHEIVHLGSRCSRAFWWTWNLVCGVPSLLPSYIIESHMLHHNGRLFGTAEDPEYRTFGLGPHHEFLVYIALSPLSIVMLFLRHLLLTPIAWASARLRRFVDEYASSGAIHMPFKRPAPRFTKADRTVEIIGFAWCATLVGLAITNVPPLVVLAEYWCVLSLALMFNSIRTVISHRFELKGPVSWEEQAMDTINLDRPSLITALLAPVGMRYHAVHHMFPRLPYHELKKAHECLLREFGANSAYASLSYSSTYAALADLWRRSGKSTH